MKKAGRFKSRFAGSFLLREMVEVGVGLQPTPTSTISLKIGLPAGQQEQGSYYTN